MSAPGEGKGERASVEEVDLTDEGMQAIPRPFWRSFGASLAAAMAGLCRTMATQRNMKVHVVSAFMVMLVGMALEMDLATKAALIFCVAVVWFAEILNTALEAFVDLHIREFHRLAMLAKDAAAAGVLVLAGGTVLIFAEVLRAHWADVLQSLDLVQKFALLGTPATLCLVHQLWGKRRSPWAWMSFLLAVLLLIPLALSAVDRLFTASAFGILILSRYARSAFAGEEPRGRVILPRAGP